MSHEDLLSFWGDQNLRRWPLESLRDVAIPESSKLFLAQVGLPLHNDWTLRFDEQAGDLARLSGQPAYRRIGLDYHVPICLDESRHGRVVAVEPPARTLYVNADVARFGICLTLYQQYRTGVRGLDEDEDQDLIGDTEEKMRHVDPTAFADAECWWPLIVEQMRQGSL